MDRYELAFYEWETKAPDAPYLKQPFGDKWETYTWGQSCTMARKMASGLLALGLPEKGHIGIISKNCREWIIADMAIMMAGYVSVPFYPTLTADQLNEVIHIGDVSAIFVGKIEDWDGMKAGIPDSVPIISFPNYEGHPRVDRGVTWQSILDKYEPLEGRHYPEQDDIWTIVFTSGTTGTPKGVVLPYSILNATKAVAESTNSLNISFDGDNRFFSYLPLNHIAERVIVETNSFAYGGIIHFTESLATFNQNLKDTSPTVFFAVPRIWTKFQMSILAKIPQAQLDAMLANEAMAPAVKKQIAESLGLQESRTNMSGAAPIAQSLKEWFGRLDIPISEGYGMTENCAICTTIKPHVHKPGSVGIAQPTTEIKIDPDTEEILMRAPFVMRGYYNDPERTEETLKDGWLHTGDQGYIDEEGYLFITGRVKDTFKTEKGEFIVPAPIEWKFAQCSLIEQLCLTGLGCPQPIMLIVLSELALPLSQEDINSQLHQTLMEVNETLPNYQKISTIITLDDPWTVENGLLTPTLKVKRKELNAKYKDLYQSWHHHPQAVIFVSKQELV